MNPLNHSRCASAALQLREGTRFKGTRWPAWIEPDELATVKLGRRKVQLVSSRPDCQVCIKSDRDVTLWCLCAPRYFGSPVTRQPYVRCASVAQTPLSMPS